MHSSDWGSSEQGSLFMIYLVLPPVTHHLFIPIFGPILSIDCKLFKTGIVLLLGLCILAKRALTSALKGYSWSPATNNNWYVITLSQN